MRLEIRKSVRGQFYVVAVGGNNEDWFTSEEYLAYATADKSAKRLIEAIRGGEVPIVDATRS